MAKGGGITARQIEDALRDRVDSLVPKLLPKARLHGGYWNIASVHGEPGEQMKINSTTGKRGLWTDFSAPVGTDEHGGDCLQLIAAVLFGGWSTNEGKKKAIAWAKSWLGWDSLDPERIEKVALETAERSRVADEAAEAEKEEKRQRADSMWRGAVPIAGTPALAYLEGRGLDFEALGKLPGSLRYLPDAWCPVRRGKHPAMIACIMGLGGQLVGVHRTYLDVSKGKSGPVTNFKLPPDSKGRRKSHKLSLGIYAGGCIPLWKGRSSATLREIPAGTPVYLSEGIEDGLTIALAQPQARVIAGVALANMGGVELPPQAGPLIFVAQRDAIGGKAVEALERAIARQQATGRQVQMILPEPGFKDFNDQLRGIRMKEDA